MALMLLVGALGLAGAPLIAAVLVSIASRREDRAWSLDGPPRGPVQSLSRRIVDFHSEGQYPLPRSRQPTADSLSFSPYIANRREEVRQPYGNARHHDPARSGRDRAGMARLVTREHSGWVAQRPRITSAAPARPASTAIITARSRPGPGRKDR